MGGGKYLLDTHYILGLLKSTPKVLSEVTRRAILTVEVTALSRIWSCSAFLALQLRKSCL